MDVALDLGIHIVHVIPGGDTDLNVLYDSLNECVAHATKKGLTLALETIVGRTIGTMAGALDML